VPSTVQVVNVGVQQNKTRFALRILFFPVACLQDSVLQFFRSSLFSVVKPHKNNSKLAHGIVDSDC
jgi:hypothetical protein